MTNTQLERANDIVQLIDATENLQRVMEDSGNCITFRKEYLQEFLPGIKTMLSEFKKDLEDEFVKL